VLDFDKKDCQVQTNPRKQGGRQQDGAGCAAKKKPINFNFTLPVAGICHPARLVALFHSG
jgi:hypothetical protein